MMYDLILKDGQVIDPASGLDAACDVAVRDGKIAAVEETLGGAGERIVSVPGCYVTPGLIDLHVHVFGGYRGWMFPDFHALSNGVTTVVDTGGAGWKSFEAFKGTIMAKSRTRVLAFLNIVGAGMLEEHEQDLEEMAVEPCAAMIRKHPDRLIGCKTAHYQGLGWDAVDRAVEAARQSGTITMIDCWPNETRPYPDLILEHMDPGDIHTHVFAAHIPVVDDRGRVQPYMHAARDRGVLFDLGHGAGSFSWDVAVPAVRQGFLPDTMGTDLHKFNALIPQAAMMTTLSKLLNLGVALPDLIQRTTVNVAQAIRRPQLGTLAIGAEADIAVLEMVNGDVGFVDCARRRVRGNQRLECALTLRRGEVVWDREGRSFPDWSGIV